MIQMNRLQPVLGIHIYIQPQPLPSSEMPLLSTTAVISPSQIYKSQHVRSLIPLRIYAAIQCNVCFTIHVSAVLRNCRHLSSTAAPVRNTHTTTWPQFSAFPPHFWFLDLKVFYFDGCNHQTLNYYWQPADLIHKQQRNLISSTF